MKRGAPKKQEQDKIKSVTPGLRVEVNKWRALTLKYPGKLNRMFNDWLNTL